jgi:exopolysaccharide biosynthesis polyprenyl glycosylphosphotransferase
VQEASEDVSASPLVYDVLLDSVDDRTRALIERRRAWAGRRRGWLVRRGLLAADFVGASLAFLVSELLLPPSASGHVDPLAETAIFVGVLPAWVVLAKLYGLYDRDEERTDHSTADDMIGVFHLVTVGTWLLYAFARLTRLADPDLLRLIVFWGVAITLVTLLRHVARTLCRRHVLYLQNTVILGTGDVGQLVARKALRHPEYGLNVVGFVDDEPKVQGPDLQHLALLGGSDELPAIVRLLDIERVIFAFSGSDRDRIELLRTLNELDVQVDIVPRFFDVLGARADLHAVEGMTLLGLRPMRLSRSSRLLKRGVDVIGAAFGLLVSAPLLGLIAALVRLDSKGPVFFRQVRMGAREETFEILKFRTMTVDAEERKAEVAHLNVHATNGGDPRMFKVADDPRVTRVGTFLRRWSLDELPQLVNVLRGEMSLVGPRPLILDEHRYVQDWAKKRLDLKPGVTGLWQCLGRSEIPFEEMVHLDYRYVTGWSLMTDVKLVLQTIPTLFRERRAY